VPLGGKEIRWGERWGKLGKKNRADWGPFRRPMHLRAPALEEGGRKLRSERKKRIELLKKAEEIREFPQQVRKRVGRPLTCMLKECQNPIQGREWQKGGRLRERKIRPALVSEVKGAVESLVGARTREGPFRESDKGRRQKKGGDVLLQLPTKEKEEEDRCRTNEGGWGGEGGENRIGSGEW